ncbi:putative Glycosyltransferase [Tripterygium wilfordii]|uniref:Glycosyltransferase n=1 Tax=Tripterygium wilfordii TaxID=458696 RepID=A0A7J7BZN4_TRIWF|nr:UDP-glycosyltransferase 71K1-like [Tripterygium wilfordii]KAF5727334.1 putative Glycosyltransferase [Tripterygium wilfordii]
MSIRQTEPGLRSYLLSSGKMKKAELIFVPFPAPTHLVPTIEFAKLLLNRDDRISVTILLMKLPGFFVDEITQSLTESRIQLVDLPHVDPPPPDLLEKSFPAYFTAYVEIHIPHVRNIVSDIVSSRSDSDSARIVGLVVDIMCVSMIDVSKELDLPSYMFLASNAGLLGLMLYLPSRHSKMSSEFHEADPELLIPGFVNQVPPRVLPEALFNKDGGYAAYIKLAQKVREAKSIIVNTFADLEESMLSSFGDSRNPNPPVYLVGPVLQPEGFPNPNLDLVQCEKTMKWLDDQPDSSVVFLCFGTAGSFGAPQLKEMALGLELSGLRFLWSVGLPRPNNEDPSSAHNTKPEDMLPDGFLGRIQGKGMICGWAPQMEILGHKAIGGFVSHCGWNSILESLWHGVPIATWPLYAEQQLNAFRMVRELGLAVDLRMDYRGNVDLVMADEVERAVKDLMSDDNEARRKVKRMSEMARIAVMDGGSSFNSVGLLIEDILAAYKS